MNTRTRKPTILVTTVGSLAPGNTEITPYVKQVERRLVEMELAEFIPLQRRPTVVMPIAELNFLLEVCMVR